MTLAELNHLADADATKAFLRCCGSPRWAEEMTTSRPFASEEALAARADEIWMALGPSDWLEAFAAHPRIGERSTSTWSSDEQAGVTDTSRDELLRLNRDYEARFGHIFIVCATGRSADELRAALAARLKNDSDAELRIAADEQRKITQIRLRKLLDEPVQFGSRHNRPA